MNKDNLYRARWAAREILKLHPTNKTADLADHIIENISEEIGFTSRENRDGNSVKENPEIMDGGIVLPDLGNLEGHFFPHNTRVDLDPDRGKTNIIPKFVLWHFTVSYDVEATVRYFKRNGVDVHFVTGHKGEVIQMAEANRYCAHAGKSEWGSYKSLNSHAIGIEHTNIGPLYLKHGSYQDSYNRKWKGQVMSNSVHGINNWEPMTEAQIRRGLEISYWACVRYGIPVSQVLGHDEVSPGRKIDPGGTIPGGMDMVRHTLEKMLIQRGAGSLKL